MHDDLAMLCELFGLRVEEIWATTTIRVADGEGRRATVRLQPHQPFSGPRVNKFYASGRLAGVPMTFIGSGSDLYRIEI